MNYATKELTLSLQQLAHGQQEQESPVIVTPEAPNLEQLTTKLGIESFLDACSEYTTKAQAVRVGAY